MVAERPPWYAVGLADKDRRGVPSARPTRATGLLVENQDITSINKSSIKYIDYQVVRYCGKEGIKNPRRRDE